MRTESLLPAILAIALAAPAAAQTGLQMQPAGGETANPAAPGLERFETEAAAIIQYDDGEPDTYSSGSSSFGQLELMMRFDDIGGTDVTLGGVDVCLRQTGSDPKIRFEVIVWTADGPGGAPGHELARYAAVAEGVTATPGFHSTSFSYPLTSPSTVYIGVRYNPVVDPSFSFCVDLDGATVHPAFYRYNEAGAWASLPAVLPSYKALMVRAYISTPGVFLESLLLPSFLIDTLSPGGTTTLYAVRNLSNAPVNADVEYFDVLGTSLLSGTISLDPDETYTANLRDVAGLPADPDGYARGYVEISTAGDPHQVPVLAGDFFQVDVADNFATGDKLVRRSTDLCTRSSIRFLTFPFSGSRTRLGLWIATPRGVGAADPASFTVQAFDEAGNPHGPLIGILTDQHSLELEASDFAGGLSFGSLHFNFTNSSGGVAYSEAQAGGRFSVGMTGQCHEAP